MTRQDGVTVVTLAKNEEAFIEEAIRSVRPIADRHLVVDTGSTDETVARAKAAGADVVHIPWENDFAKARNAALGHVRTPWVFMMDADERLQPCNAKRFRKTLKSNPQIQAYHVRISSDVEGGEVEVSHTLRIFRNKPEYRFERKLHEQVVFSIMEHNPGKKNIIGFINVTLRHLGYQQDVVAKKDKRARNLALAQADWDTHQDAFSAFNLGTELALSGDAEEAEQLFRTSLRLLKGHPPWSAKLALGFAYVLFKSQQHETILEEIAALEPHYPGLTDLHFYQAEALSALGRYREASRAYQVCVDQGPAPCPPWTGIDPGAGGYKARLGLARTLALSGEHAASLEQLSKAYALRPGPQTLRPAIALLLEHPELGDVMDLAKWGPPGDTHLHLGAALMFQGQRALAARAFSEAAPGDPSGKIAILAARMFIDSGNGQAALAELRRAPADGPVAQEAQAERLCAWLLVDEGRAKELATSRPLVFQAMAHHVNPLLQKKLQALWESLEGGA